VSTEINPKGLVPAIEYQGKALYESLVLNEFLEDAYPQYAQHLLPEDPYERARARIWIDHISKSFLPWFMRLLQYQDPEKQQEALKEVQKSLSALSAQRKGPFFFGYDFSLVDAAIAPWAVREHIIIEHRGHRREDVGNDWKAWAELLEIRPSVWKTTSVSSTSRWDP
jgi:glutathione S-transferase